MLSVNPPASHQEKGKKEEKGERLTNLILKQLY